MKLHVTESHIAAGTRKNAGCCPIALALADVYRNTTPSVVGNGATVWWPNRINRIYLLPVQAQIWLGRFDRGDPVDAATFELQDMTGFPIRRVPMKR